MKEPNAAGSAATVVVGHRRDLSSERALAVAMDLGQRLNAQLRVVHVVELSDYPDDSDSADWEQRGEETLDQQRYRVERTLAGYTQDWGYEVRRGNPASELARVAQENNAILIVLGSRGSGIGAKISRLCRPSVSHGTIECQHRPVLVVPPPRPRRQHRRRPLVKGATRPDGEPLLRG
ncbi:MAG: universal stress protein [Pseudonocardia sp.]|nr:universal stress protein [Pseudonocardia sp.]